VSAASTQHPAASVVRVFHCRLSAEGRANPTVSDFYAMRIAFRADPLAVKEVLSAGQDWASRGLSFQAVAEVDGEDLEEAFRLTNHIDRSWTTNREVRTIGLGPFRSTSVGDLMQVECEGQFSTHLVASIGFDDLDLAVDLRGPSDIRSSASTTCHRSKE
jgi:hypothetical protein